MSKVTLIINSDTFRVHEYLRSLNTPTKFFLEKEIQEFIKEIQQQSLFTDNSILVLISPLNKLTESDYKIIKNSHKKVVLWDKSKKPNESILSKNKIEYDKKILPELKGSALFKWIKQRALEKHLDLSREAINKFIMLHGSNLFFVENDLSVLHLFYDSDESNIVKVDSLPPQVISAGTTDFNIFDFLDVIGSRDKNAILRKLHHVTETNDEWSLFYQLVGHMRKLLKKKLGETVTSFAFIEQKLNKQSAKWSEAELENSLATLLEIELAVKKGETELKPELVRWILKTTLAIKK